MVGSMPFSPRLAAAAGELIWARAPAASVTVPGSARPVERQGLNQQVPPVRRHRWRDFGSDDKAARAQAFLKMPGGAPSVRLGHRHLTKTTVCDSRTARRKELAAKVAVPAAPSPCPTLLPQRPMRFSPLPVAR